jgi:hypothetical protein
MVQLGRGGPVTGGGILVVVHESYLLEVVGQLLQLVSPTPREYCKGEANSVRLAFSPSR